MKKIIAIVFILIIGFLAYWFFNRPNGQAGQPNLATLPGFGSAEPKEGGIVNNFFRGNSLPNSTSTADGVKNITPGGKFAVIAKGPIAGSSALIGSRLIPGAKKGTNKEVTEAIWFIQKDSGNIFTLSIKDGASGLTQATNTTIPSIRLAILGGTAEIPRLLLGYDKGQEIENILGGVKYGSSTIGEFDGKAFDQGIYSVAVSPSKDSLAYIISSENGSVGYLMDFYGKGKRQFFSSPFPKWQISWPDKERILLQTAPSHKTAGAIYALNLKDSSFKKILSNVKGITALASPDWKKLIYSGSEDGHALKLLTVSGGQTSNIGLATLPEKCVWSKSSKFLYCSVPNKKPGLTEPDSWYQGISSFDDSLWRIDTATGATEIIYNPSQGSGLVDGTNLFLSLAEDKLYGLNKRDGTLWRLLLKDSFSGVSSSPASSTKS